MARSWSSGVKDAGELIVYNDLTSGGWVHIFKIALQLFNALGLPVKMSEVKNESSANVVMRVASGLPAYEYNGTSYSSPKPFDPKRLHGYTMLLHAQDGPIEKAVVFLPSAPQSGPTFPQYARGKAVYEKATPEMMKVIAVHELIHACGLDNNDHATDDGVFYFPLAPSGTGKMIVPRQGQDQKPMPPIRISQSTVGRVASLW